MGKNRKIGGYEDDGRSVDTVDYYGCKNQPRDNKGRYIHVGALGGAHIDNYEKRNKEGKNEHIAIAELMTVPCKDFPKTEPIPWDYDNYCLGGSIVGTGIKIERHRGSLTIRGSPQSRGYFLVGTPNPSQFW